MNLYTSELAAALFEEAGDALFLFDPQSERILKANAGAQRLTGWTEAELAPLAMTSLFRFGAPGDRQRMRAACDRTAVFHSQDGYFLRTKRGDWIAVNLTISRLHLQSGPVGLMTVRDVTERRRAEQTLRNHEQQLRAIFETSPECITVVARDGTLLQMNRAGLQMLEAERPEELLGRPVLEVIAPEHRQPFRDFHEAVCRGERGSLAFDMVGLQGGRRAVQTTAAPLAGADGATAQLAVTRDVTAAKHLEEQLRQAQKMEAVGRLAAGVAHDFNNLLTIMSGHSELLLRGFAEDAPTAKGLREIHKAGVQAALLTRQLLAFSRKEIIAPVVLDLSALVRETDKMLHRLIGEDVELVTELEPDLAPVRADPGHLEQVLLNLVLNARDAMPRGGRITVRTENVRPADVGRRGPESGSAQPLPHVLLAVADTGCGMSPEVRTRIFEPFFTTKGVGKGTGLGLSTVYGIVAQAGGFIEVDSTPGRGSTFRVYLPVTPSMQRLRKSEQNRAPIPQGRETVLVVEDEEGVRRLAGSVLRDSGYAVLEARDGAEGLEIARRHAGPIDLLLTDVVMPRLGGRELAEQLRALRPRSKVLFTSGYTEDKFLRDGLREATFTFLAKPYSPLLLARKVREVLDGG
jgi:two-component system cell cycle sensor histidine kinase/response regulator CckA